MKRISMIAIIVLGIISLWIDIADIPTKLGFHFNLDYWNIYIVLFLFVFGYFLIDKKLVDKENNKKSLLKYLIKDNYKRCLDMLDFIETRPRMVGKVLNKKLKDDSNLKLKDINIYKNVYNNENLIYELIKDGTGEKELIEEYFDVKYKYMEILEDLAGCIDNTEKVNKLIIELKEFLIKKEEQI